MMTRAIRSLVATAAAMAVSGCAIFGDAETPQQKSYRTAAILAYLQIPLKVYVTHPAADPRAVDTVRQVEQVAYEAIQTARAAIEGGGDTVTAAAFAASKVASLSLQVVGSFSLPTSELDAARTAVILATVGLRSIGEMRLFREGFVQPKMEGFAATGSDPTELEWSEILTLVEQNHSIIRGGGA